MARQQLQNLTEPMYYLLLSLYSPRHGYEIMQFIQDLTDSRVRVGAGTLYSLLARFEAEGLIQQVGQEGRRKIYKIKPYGRKMVEEEHQRLRRMLEDGDKFIGG